MSPRSSGFSLDSKTISEGDLEDRPYLGDKLRIPGETSLATQQVRDNPSTRVIAFPSGFRPRMLAWPDVFSSDFLE